MALDKTCEKCGRQYARGEKRNRAGGIVTCYTCRPKTNHLAALGITAKSLAAGITMTHEGKIYSGDGSVRDAPPEKKREIKIDEESVVMRTLQQCGEGRVLAQIAYQKPGEKWVTERKIEPYQFTYSAGGIIVRTWQVDPGLDEPSWRSFRVDRIIQASPTATIFRPRQPITLHTGEVSRFIFGDDPQGREEKAPPPIEVYTLRLHEALADLELTEEERRQLMEVSTLLHIEQIRAVHGRFYAEALAEICADGRVTQNEMDKLTTIRVWLTELGWCP